MKTRINRSVRFTKDGKFVFVKSIVVYTLKYLCGFIFSFLCKANENNIHHDELSTLLYSTVSNKILVCRWLEVLVVPSSFSIIKKRYYNSQKSALKESNKPITFQLDWDSKKVNVASRRPLKTNLSSRQLFFLPNEPGC